MKDDVSDAGTTNSYVDALRPASTDGTTRRAFLERLRKTAAVAVPVIAAVALTPSKALASP
jgi:hypothetical protein